VTFAGLNTEQIERIVRDYRTPSLTVRDVAMRNNIGRETLMNVVRAAGIELRGRKRTGSWLKPPRRAVKPGDGYMVDDVLEQAKLKLRQRGHYVWGAEVTDGRKARGLFRFDGALISRDELLTRAKKVR